MSRMLCLAGVLSAASCGVAEAPPPPPPRFSPAAAPLGVAADDGTYLRRIDPLGGQWSIDRLGNEDFRRFKGWINFSAGGFLNHGAGCAGGYPAFYRLEGQSIALTRRESIQVGKCAGADPTARAASAASERRLAAFLDQLSMWERPNDQTVILTARDGTRALLSRPIEPHPELAGRWLIETIGGKALVTERRPPTLTITMGSIGVFADCNSMGTQFTVPAPGRIAVTGHIVGTAIGCAPEDLAEDELMARAIQSATAYRFENGRLIFTGGPGMVVRRLPPADRRLAGQYKSCGNTLLGGYHEGPITLSIDERTMRDNAGCQARYTAQGPNLTLDFVNSPACAAKPVPFVPGEPVPVGGPISTLAVTRPDGFGFTDDGQLVLRTHRGLLTMCRIGAPPPFGD